MEINKKVMFGWPVILSIISALVLIGTAIYTKIESNRLEVKNDGYQKKIGEQQNELLKTSQDLAEANRKIYEKSDELLALYRKLDLRDSTINGKSDLILGSANELNEANKKSAEFEKELYNQATGGNSFRLVFCEMVQPPPTLSAHPFKRHIINYPTQCVFKLKVVGNMTLRM
ncbi:MAG: hypothetical protein ABI358_00600 [Ginsengibacter sp.]